MTTDGMSLGILWIVGEYANYWTTRVVQKCLYLCYQIYINIHFFHSCPIVLMETWAPLISLTPFFPLINALCFLIAFTGRHLMNADLFLTDILSISTFISLGFRGSYKQISLHVHLDCCMCHSFLVRYSRFCSSLVQYAR